jgi:hypothetical protein
LKQTEIFSHFMPGSGKLTPEKKKPGRKKDDVKKKEPTTPIDPAE